jgi:hypothetical protein
MKKFSNDLNLITLGLIWGILILYIIILVYPFKVIEFNTPYKILTPVVHQGGQMQYLRDSEKFIQVEGSINCHFEDGLIYTVSSFESNNKVGKLGDIIAIDIPSELPVATYIYKCTVTYRLFGIRELRYEFQTDNFEVIK